MCPNPSDQLDRDGADLVAAERGKALKRAWYAANRNRILTQLQIWRAANREELRAGNRRYYARNAERLRQCAREYRLANPEKLKERQRARRATNPARIAQQAKMAYQKHREERLRYAREYSAQHREKQIAERHGLSVNEYRERWIQQNSGCAICKKPINGRRPSIDHDHKTGVVRGLLCVKCNAGIALLGDNLRGVEAALIYLMRHQP